MDQQLTAGQKAALTRKRRAAAEKAVQKRKQKRAWKQAHDKEAASKAALETYCKKHGWKLAFFEGKTGAPRTGIIDAVAFQLDRKNADALQIRLIQLKGGKAGVSAQEITRLKKAAVGATVDWLIAEFDDETLHWLHDEPES
jgi:hypothetical protein